jgi:hypothetical protein
MNMSWHKIFIADATATQAIYWSNDLRQEGLVINVDFQWRYLPRLLSEEHGNSVQFEFRDAALATFYGLKWNYK